MAHVQSTGLATSSNSELETKALPWAWLVLLLSAAGVAGSLFLSIGLELRACPLCFYQRTFMMAVFAVLGVGIVADRSRAGLLCLLSLPLVAGGLGVAAFHEYLVLSGKLECPAGLFGLGTAPAQSLAAFGLLTLATILGAWSGRGGGRPRGTFTPVSAAVLGALLAWGSVASPNFS